MAAAAAHSSIPAPLNLQNGRDGGIGLYKLDKAVFRIVDANSLSDTDENKLYIKGRVIFYVGWIGSEQYSFIDDVIQVADGLKVVNTSNTCAANTAGFANRLIINESPTAALNVLPFPGKISCKGFKSSSLEENLAKYTVSCKDGRTLTFGDKQEVSRNCDPGNRNCYTNIQYENYDEELGRGLKLSVDLPGLTYTYDSLKSALDKNADTVACYSWSKKG